MAVKNKHNLTLSSKILLGILPVVFVSLTVVGFANYFVARGRIIKGIQYEVDSLTGQISSALKVFFEQRDRDLETLAEAPLFIDYYKNIEYGLMSEAEAYRREIENYFLKFFNRSQVYSLITYVNVHGVPVAAVHNGKIIRKMKDIPAFELPPDLRERGTYRDSEPNRDVPKELLYAKILKDDSGTYYGSLVLKCNLSFVEKILYRGQIGAKGGACLVDALGKHVLGGNLVTSYPAEVADLSASNGLNLNLKDSLVSESAVIGFPWKVRVIADPEEFLKPLVQIRNLTVLFSLLAGFCLAVILIFIIRKAIRPIGDMVAGTKKLAEGNLAYRFQESGISELKSLTKAFNAMAQSLQQRNLELEQKIKQLTSLREMEESILQRLSEEEMLRICLATVSQGFSFDRTGLYWIDTSRKEIVGRYLYATEAAGFSEHSFRERKIPLGETDFLNEIAATRKAVLVKDIKNNPQLNIKYAQESKTNEFVLAPICGEQKVFGILAADNYYNHRPLQDSDKDGLMLFANAMGLALENTSLVQHLSESELRHRTILENSPVAILGLNRDHKINTWNRGAEDIFGYSTKEIIGKPLTALFPSSQEFEKAFKSLVIEVIQAGSVRDYSIMGVAKNGKKLDLSLSWGGAYPDYTMNKEWTIVIRDVTDAKKLQQQIIHSEKLSAVGQLISSIAHELNNPLQAVIGYSQIVALDTQEILNLQQQTKNKKQSVNAKDLSEDIKLLVDNAMRCRKIIDNLLLFVRHHKIEKRAVRLKDAIEPALTLLEYKLRKTASIQVHMDFPNDLPFMKADLQQIQQVFMNLINNACDAMFDWKGDKAIWIRAMSVNNMVHIELSDTGPGIPSEILHNIFEPFFTTKPEGRGTGLGLSVCRQIIEDHGGQIGCNSLANQGTTFWFELPITYGDYEVEDKIRPAVNRGKGKSVLVVDDEADVLSFYHKVVEDEVQVSETAASFREAAQKIAQRHFDLVIIDIQLGDGSGIELHDFWPQWSKFPKPTFLFLTGDVLNPVLMQIIEEKNLNLLKKPVSIETLQDAIRTIFSDGKIVA